MLTNSIILTNSGRNTLGPPTSSLGPVQIVHVALNTMNSVVQQSSFTSNNLH